MVFTSICFCPSDDVDVTIEGPGKTDIVKKKELNGVLTIDYVPVVPGEYLVSIKCGDKHIYGSPFSAKITGWFTLQLVLVLGCIDDTYRPVFERVSNMLCSCMIGKSIHACKTFINRSLFKCA